MSELTYPEVGGTRDGALPAGYDHLRYRTHIGRDVLDAAGEAILTWRMHRAAGVRMDSTASRAAPGVRVTPRVGVGPLRLPAPCEVVWTVSDGRRAGFGYGTLPGHPSSGEESFTVERIGDHVWFSVTAFSRPAAWYARAAGPVVPLLQRAYARRLGAALRRLCS